MSGPVETGWQEPAALLAADREGWRDLLMRAVEPNPFYDHAFAGAVHAHLPGHDAMRIVTARRDGQLIGLFPLMPLPPARGGLPGLGLWMGLWNPFVTSGLPLLDRAQAPEAWMAMSARLHAEGVRQIVMPLLPSDHGGLAALQAGWDALGVAPFEVARHQRPAIESPLDPKAYRARYSKKRRRNVEGRVRLADKLGTVTAGTFRGADEPGAAATFEAFLALEASGWKGAAGTALASRPETLDFAREVFRRGGPLVHIDVLENAGRAVAANFNLVVPGALFAFKSAYDERESALGPGVVLDHHLLCQVLEGAYPRADSCADETHRLMGEWLERETVVTLVLPTSAAEPAWRTALARLAVTTAWKARLAAKAGIARLRPKA